MATTLPISVRCIGYVRVSTDRQAGETQTSLADQAAAIRSLAARLGTSVDTWYRDDGASGASVEHRPGFRALLVACEADPRSAREPGLILVLNDSRFGRFPDPDEAAAIRWRLKQAGWIVRFAEGDDVEDVMFRSMIRSIGSAQASEYRRNIQRNARRGARGTVEQGFWRCRAPIGYRRFVAYPPAAERTLEAGQHKAPNEKVKLVPHEDEARIVRWAFESYASGAHSLGTLADALHELLPGRRWGRTVVQHLLQNEAYLGHIIGGRRPADRNERLVTPRRPESEWYRCDNAHPAIVSREVFDRVQAQLGRNQLGGRAVWSFYLVTGILACPHCGHRYIGGGGGVGRKFYKDAGGIRGGCPGRLGIVMRHSVDDWIIGTLASLIASRPFRCGLEREIDRALDAAAGIAVDSEADLRAGRAKLERRRDRLVALIADGTLLKHEAAAELERTRRALEDINVRLETTRFGRRRARGARSERDRMLQVALDFPDAARRLEGPKLRQIVEPWVHHVTFDKLSRELELGINRLPFSFMQPAGLPGLAGQEKAARPLIRRLQLRRTG